MITTCKGGGHGGESNGQAPRERQAFLVQALGCSKRVWQNGSMWAAASSASRAPVRPSPAEVTSRAHPTAPRPPARRGQADSLARQTHQQSYSKR